MSKDTTFSSYSINCRKKIISFDAPAVMGILNFTPDSFYDGGTHNSIDQAVAHTQFLLSEGADIIDVGLLSSRPGAVSFPAEVEVEKLRSLIPVLRRNFPDAVFSVDTFYAASARAAIECGADIINDIGGGRFDPDMFSVVADLQVPYILMHNSDSLASMHQPHFYSDILQEVSFFFSQQLEKLYRLGVKDVWLDPGFGFAKSVDQNFELFNRIDALSRNFREPLLVAISRKSMIYKTLNSSPADALNGTTALHAKALMLGARILRVHDPRAARETIQLIRK